MADVYHETVYFSGHVQGVGFRYSTLAVSHEFEVAGYVCNLPDGRVQVEAEGAKADPRNWGFAGSLGKVRRDLIDLVGFLSNMDPEHVEAFLNDAE